jgi:hypothetical protein
MSTSFQDNITFSGICTFANNMVLAANCVNDANVGVNAAIDADKLQHRHPLSVELFPAATAITAGGKLLHISAVTGAVVALQAVAITAATGVDRTVVIDLQKSTGGAAFATVLTTTITLNASSVARVAQAAVVDATKISLAVGDLLQLVWTVAGSAGDQAKGLLVTAIIDENAA